jgi:hypothetical protein
MMLEIQPPRLQPEQIVGLKLQQGQVWKHGKEFVRIVHLARLEVGYKVMKDLRSGRGTHHQTSKKDFCRLLKSARLLGPAKATTAPLTGSDESSPDQPSDRD